MKMGIPHLHRHHHNHYYYFSLCCYNKYLSFSRLQRTEIYSPKFSRLRFQHLFAGLCGVFIFNIMSIDKFSVREGSRTKRLPLHEINAFITLKKEEHLWLSHIAKTSYLDSTTFKNMNFPILRDLSKDWPLNDLIRIITESAIVYNMFHFNWNRVDLETNK